MAVRADEPTGVVRAFRETIEIGPAWRVKPAANPDASPTGDDWGNVSSRAGDWRWGAVDAKGTSWEKTISGSGGRTGVHSLWYEQTVSIPASWEGTRVALWFKRIEGDAVVFLDGSRQTELLRPGGEVDLSDVIRAGHDHTLWVFLTRDYTGISRGLEHDPLRHTARAPGVVEKASPGRWGLFAKSHQ